MERINCIPCAGNFWTEMIECRIEKLERLQNRFPVDVSDGQVIKFVKCFVNHVYRSANRPFRKNGKNAGYYNKDKSS